MAPAALNILNVLPALKPIYNNARFICFVDYIALSIEENMFVMFFITV